MGLLWMRVVRHAEDKDLFTTFPLFSAGQGFLSRSGRPLLLALYLRIILFTALMGGRRGIIGRSLANFGR